MLLVGSRCNFGHDARPHSHGSIHDHQKAQIVGRHRFNRGLPPACHDYLGMQLAGYYARHDPDHRDYIDNGNQGEGPVGGWQRGN